MHEALTGTEIDDVVLIEPKVFGDDRGFFFESYNRDEFARLIGTDRHFVQDNHSRSARGVLRGLHYQVDPHAQAKLVRCGRGAVWDVAVDIRSASPTFSRWVGAELNEENKYQLWIPEGFAHGFVALTDDAELLYKTTHPYAPESDRSIRFDDPDIAIAWPLDGEPTLAAKDADAPLLRDAEVFS